MANLNVVILDDQLDALNISEQGKQRALQKAQEVYVITLLEMGEITSGRAAKLLGISRLEAIEMMNQRGISIFDDSQDLESLKDEVTRVELLLHQHQMG